MTVSTEDHVAISDHLARYCHAIDEGRLEDWLALWTQDGTFAIAGMDPASGREALSGVVARVNANGHGLTRHMITNLVCDYGGDHDTVLASYYNLVTNWTQGAKIVALVLSKAAVVRRGSGWLVQRIDLATMMG